MLGYKILGCCDTNCGGLGYKLFGCRNTNCWGVMIQPVGVSGYKLLGCLDTISWCLRIKKTVSMSGNKLLGCKGTIFQGVGTQTVLDCHGVRIQPVELLGYKLSRGQDTNCQGVMIQTFIGSVNKLKRFHIQNAGLSL